MWRYLALALFLISCSGPPENRQRPLRLNLYNEPPTLDPGKARDVTSRTVLQMLYDGLTRIDGEGEVVLAAADAVECSPDGYTYTFTIRPAMWSNGDQVTSHDFANAWARVLDPDFPSESPELLYILDEVACPDSETLVVRLTHPAPYFLSLVSTTTFYPVHGEAFNGPFVIEEWLPHNQLIVARNPNYWNVASVHLPRIEMCMVEDANTELQMFEQGQIDWAGGPMSVIPFDAVPGLRAQGLLHSHPISAVYWYQFNQERFPFNNAKVRQAFSLSVNRQMIVEHISKSSHTVATGFVPGQLIDTGNRPFDREDGLALFEEGLTELGVSRDEVGPILLSINSSCDHLQIAQAVQQEWQERLGVRVEIQVNEWQAHLAALSRGDYQVGRLGWHCRYPDAIDLLNQFRHGPLRVSEAFVALLDRADLEADPEQYRQLLIEAEELLLAEMPAIPLFFITYNHLRHPDIQNVIFTTTGQIDFRHAYFK